MKLKFEWDAAKAKTNYKSHRISFDEAATVFSDSGSITISDPDHSQNEQRYIDIGLSEKGRLLVVIYTERSSNIRIISSRKATLKEQKLYEENTN